MPWGWVAAATVGSSLIGADAASSAADAQSASADKANATQRYMYDQTRADNAGFMNNGQSANNALARLLGVARYNSDNPFTNPDANAAVDSLMAQSGASRDAAIQQVKTGWNAQYAPVDADPSYGSLLHKFSASDLAADPVYNSGLQFGLDQGAQGINRMAAANGGLDSGATLKALTRFGNDYGSTKANESYNRFMNTNQNTFNMLSGVSGTGQVAGGQVASAGQNMSNNVSQNQIGVGNARAASMIGGANAIAGGVGTGINAYQQNQMMNMYGNRTNALLGYGGAGSSGTMLGSGYGSENISGLGLNNALY